MLMWSLGPLSNASTLQRPLGAARIDMSLAACRVPKGPGMAVSLNWGSFVGCACNKRSLCKGP